MFLPPTALRSGSPFSWGVTSRGPSARTRGPIKGRLKNGAAELMREANEIGSGSGARARQGRGVRRRSAPFRSCSSLGIGLLEENMRAVQRFARLCSYRRRPNHVRFVVQRTRTLFNLQLNKIGILLRSSISAYWHLGCGLQSQEEQFVEPRMLALRKFKSTSSPKRSISCAVITPPEETEHGNAAQRPGSGGRPRGCEFEEQGGGHVRVHRGGSITYSHFVCLFVCLFVCASKSKLPNHLNQAHTLSRPIFKHAQHTHAAPTLPLGDTPNTRALPQTRTRTNTIPNGTEASAAG